MFGSDYDPSEFFQPGGFLRPQTESSTNFLLIRKLHE